MRILSVNTGRAVPADWPKLKRTAIDKQPITGRAAVHENGVEGNERADTENHGVPDQAIYAYAREDLDWWAAQLGRDLHNGVFGETITTSGIDVNGSVLGERWRIGHVLLEVTGPRVPCNTFQGWMGEKGWVKRFTEANRSGAYLRVLETGELGAGDRIEVVHAPSLRVTIAESFRAYHGDADLMRRLLDVPGIADKWHLRAERVLGDAARQSAAG